MTEPKAEEWWLDDSLPTGAPEEQVPDVSDIFVLSELDRSSETNPILTDAFFDVEYVDGKSVFLDTLLAESAGSETEPALLPSEVFNTHMGGGTIPTTLGVAQITAVITATLETLETPFMYKERDLKWKLVHYSKTGLYASCAIRIWRMRDTTQLTVHVSRKCGAREVSSCLFEFVKKALEAETPAGVKELPLEDWDVMWRPRPLSEAFLRNVPHPCAEAAEAGIISFVNCLTSEIDTVVGNACASVIGNLSGRVDDVQLAMYRHPLLIDALVNVALGSLSIETVTRAAMALSMMAKEADAVVLIARAKLVVPGGTPFQLMADRCGATAGPREEAFEVTCFRRYCTEALANVISVPEVIASVREVYADIHRAFLLGAVSEDVPCARAAQSGLAALESIAV